MSTVLTIYVPSICMKVVAENNSQPCQNTINARNVKPNFIIISKAFQLCGAGMLLAQNIFQFMNTNVLKGPGLVNFMGMSKGSA